MTASSLYESWVNSLAHGFRNEGLDLSDENGLVPRVNAPSGVFGMSVFFLSTSD